MSFFPPPGIFSLHCFDWNVHDNRASSSIHFDWMGIVWIFSHESLNDNSSALLLLLLLALFLLAVLVMMFTRFDISFFNPVIGESFSEVFFANCAFVVNSVWTWDLSLHIIATRFSIATSIFLSCVCDSIYEFAPNPAFSAVNLLMSSFSWNVSVHYFLNSTHVFCAWVLLFQTKYASAYSPLFPTFFVPLKLVENPTILPRCLQRAVDNLWFIICMPPFPVWCKKVLWTLHFFFDEVVVYFPTSLLNVVEDINDFDIFDPCGFILYFDD